MKILLFILFGSLLSVNVAANKPEAYKMIAHCMARESLDIWWTSGHSIARPLYLKCKERHDKGERRSTEFKRKTLSYYHWVINELNDAAAGDNRTFKV